MYQRYLTYKKQLYQQYHMGNHQDAMFITSMVLLILFKSLVYFFWLLSSGRGIPQSDDSTWYINYAHALMTNCTVGLHMNDLLYFGYNILLTVLLAVFKDPIAVVFMQIITTSFSVILVYKIARMLFNRTTAVLASIFYCLIWDFTLWAIYILSDSFFVSLLLLCVYFLLRALETKQRKYKLWFVISSLYLLVFRPTGIITMFMMIIYILIQLEWKELATTFWRKKIVVGCVLLLATLAGTYTYMNHTFDILIQSLQFNAKGILYNVYAKGWIYDKSTAYDYLFKADYSITVYNSVITSFIINNWDHILTIYLRRAAAFLGTWVWETNLHTGLGIISFAGNLIPAALFMVGTVAAIVNKQFKKASILWLLTVSAIAFCMFLFIDAMYRYRFPAMPFIAIVAAYGMERIIYGGNCIAKKYVGHLLYGTGKNSDRHSRVQ